MNCTRDMYPIIIPRVIVSWILVFKYEEKLRVDEVAFYLYYAEKQNRIYAKSKSKTRIKELLQEILTDVTDTELIIKIQKQLEKY